MISVRKLCVEKGKKKIVRNASFDIRPGKITVVLGRNGAGKSTLLKALAGNTDFAGQVSWDGYSLPDLGMQELARRRAVLSQHTNVAFPVQAEELVKMGAYVSQEALSDKKLQHLVRHALEQVNMTNFANRVFSTLSGGEQKRILLAKCIVQLNCCDWASTHKYLLLDEPTASLDVEQKYLLLQLVKKWVRRRNIGVLAVLHDINLAAMMADEILLMKDGYIAYKGAPDVVFTEEILREVLGVRAIVGPHPVLPCLHITSLPDTNSVFYSKPLL